MRLFVTQSQINDNIVTLTDDEFHYISRVKRLKKNEIFHLVVDEQQIVKVRCQTVFSNTIRFKIISSEDIETSNLNITLVQALSKKDKMSDIIDFVTQVGVSFFLPISMTRSVVDWDQKKNDKNELRWKQKALYASMQSTRSHIPYIHPVITFDNFVSNWDFSNYDYCFVPWEEEKKSTLKSVLNTSSSIKSICIVIGPEGGMTSIEIDELTSKGFQSVTLGKSILRVEIAGLSTISQISALLS